jgi:hypothetical protein
VSAKGAFVAFTEVEQGRHAEYNEWHQLDHRPENLDLPGVIWGERWVKSPDCAPFALGDDQALIACHYVTMYWWRDPLETSVAEWLELGSMSYQWGRRPELPYVKRPLGQRLVPVKGYVSPDAKVSIDALPIRPNRGVHISVTDVSGDLVAVGELYEWYDTQRIPELLQIPGVAGVWTLVDQGGVGGTRPGASVPTGRRVTVVFLDRDPVELAAMVGYTEAHPSGLETVRFSSPLRAITPWEWGWFD